MTLAICVGFVDIARHVLLQFCCFGIDVWSAASPGTTNGHWHSLMSKNSLRWVPAAGHRRVCLAAIRSDPETQCGSERGAKSFEVLPVLTEHLL